jgi:hypothetical protein
MKTQDPAKLAKAQNLWQSMKSRARISRRPAMTGEACSCFISEKQGAYLRSLCWQANIEHPSSPDTFGLEMGCGLALSPSKFGYRCDWQEFPAA